ncbi:MAG: 16S rRNA processing protein RimM [Candidatus Nitronauta litoralis]|uniref:Ribosome maturation factor RimM n=1 Tax=Candidatus Nitronauta litoralis TaxID=2705533 RepID=A0A7T0BZH2_9BACT|nr:MAG: 16S rRNA processing protein RimM [Candidatus Nitronauta litoralis]
MHWVPVGRLVKPHGLKGEFKFKPEISDTTLLGDLKKARLESDPETAAPRTISSLRGHGLRLILKLEGINSIEEAEPLCGLSLLVSQDEFPRLPDGEYYWFQIHGLKAYDETGKYFGTVSEIIETGSNDVYVVREGSNELLLPMIDEVVRSIDLDQQKLVFHAIDGLL